MASSLKKKGVHGIEVQASRFAIIAPDSDSDEDQNCGGSWLTTPPKPFNRSKKPGKGSKEENHVSKAATKNAKRRAKKRGKDSFSSDQSGDGSGPKYSNWLERNTAQEDKEFEKDLETALMNSMVDRSNKPETDGQGISKEQEVPEDVNDTAKPPKSKKGVTLSLQEFHNSDFSPHQPFTNGNTTPLQQHDDNEEGETGGEDFFEFVKKDIQKELKQSKEMERKAKSKKTSKKSNSPNVDESVRVAQVRNELEEKEEVIAAMKKDNARLVEELKEVKRRNQVLYKMLSKGEISSKSELLQQLEELTIVKNELSNEVERLHSELEQERSKNKSLKTELLSNKSAHHNPKH